MSSKDHISQSVMGVYAIREKSRDTSIEKLIKRLENPNPQLLPYKIAKPRIKALSIQVDILSFSSVNKGKLYDSFIDIASNMDEKVEKQQDKNRISILSQSTVTAIENPPPRSDISKKNVNWLGIEFSGSVQGEKPEKDYIEEDQEIIVECLKGAISRSATAEKEDSPGVNDKGNKAFREDIIPGFYQGDGESEINTLLTAKYSDVYKRLVASEFEVVSSDQERKLSQYYDFGEIDQRNIVEIIEEMQLFFSNMSFKIENVSYSIGDLLSRCACVFYNMRFYAITGAIGKPILKSFVDVNTNDFTYNIDGYTFHDELRITFVIHFIIALYRVYSGVDTMEESLIDKDVLKICNGLQSNEERPALKLGSKQIETSGYVPYLKK